MPHRKPLFQALPVLQGDGGHPQHNGNQAQDDARHWLIQIFWAQMLEYGRFYAEHTEARGNTIHAIVEAAAGNQAKRM